MRFARSRHPERQLAVDFTSMVDVVFLLIIFFMTAAQFARITRAEVELPQEPGERLKQPDEAGIVINITEVGEIIVGSDTLDIEDLRATVEREIRTTYHGNAAAFKLMIRADRRCDTARLNQIVGMLRELDVAATRVATEVPRGRR
jgi:biopolymer transport protein ExbD